MKTGKVYRLVSKYRKHPELLLNYGFNFYEDEDHETQVFAYPIKLAKDNPLFIQCVRFLEHCYEEATTEEREKDFMDYEFRLELQENQKNAWRLVLTQDLIDEFSNAQLCVTLDKASQDCTFLFINSPIQNAYYHADTVRECAPEFIKRLFKDKVIYTKKIKYK